MLVGEERIGSCWEEGGGIELDEFSGEDRAEETLPDRFRTGIESEEV